MSVETKRMFAKGKVYHEASIDGVERFYLVQINGGYLIYPLNSGKAIAEFPTMWECKVYISEMDK